MKHPAQYIALSVMVLVSAGFALGGNAAPAAPVRSSVAAEEQAQWLRWVIPLPKEVAIGEKLVLEPSDVHIRTRKDAGEQERFLASRLAKLEGDAIRLLAPPPPPVPRPEKTEVVVVDEIDREGLPAAEARGLLDKLRDKVAAEDDPALKLDLHWKLYREKGEE